jgi:hypothetical protein
VRPNHQTGPPKRQHTKTQIGCRDEGTAWKPEAPAKGTGHASFAGASGLKTLERAIREREAGRTELRKKGSPLKLLVEWQSNGLVWTAAVFLRRFGFPVLVWFGLRRCFSAALVFLVFCEGGIQTTMQPGSETQSERGEKPKRRRSTAAVQTRPQTKAAEKHRRSPDQTKTEMCEDRMVPFHSSASMAENRKMVSPVAWPAHRAIRCLGSFCGAKLAELFTCLHLGAGCR